MGGVERGEREGLRRALARAAWVVLRLECLNCFFKRDDTLPKLSVN